MSLNGLDNAQVKEAHEAAVAEAGGWFLLKYASRDEVEVLAKGSKGVVEMRSSIETYEEPSPLFGFLRYRRRNVLIKYMPEGCSRLIQARSTVHFNAICERFGPCETTFDITEPKELNDAKLSNACSLHTASASTSSSNSSLRRRRLMEIAEEEEEEHRESKRQSILEEADEDTKPVEFDQNQDQPRPRSPITGPPVTLDSNLASSPKESQFADTVEPPSFIGVPRPASPAKSFDDARRMSSQSSRQDYYSSSSYLHSKPRVKLGPRPSADPTGRPRTSASGNTVRPVASMPAGLKLSIKGAKKGKHDDSSSVMSEEHAEDAFLAPSLAIPEDGSLLHASGGRPTTSSGASVKSLPAVTTPAKNILTPEKLRLMKAMQLREKKKRASEMQATPVPSVQITASPAVPTDDEEPQTTMAEMESQETMLQPVEIDSEPNSDQVSKADSGIDVASSVPTDHGSVRTQTDSRPTSPVGASSEVGNSTQASSVSESTDETVHPPQENKEVAVEESEMAKSSPQVEEVPSAQGQDAPGSDPSQDIPVAEANLAEADETRDDQETKHVDKLTPVSPEEEGISSEDPESNNIIPTSKFAAKVASGQAATDPMASRDADPPNVTSVPERIDEVDPAPVDPSERTEDGPAASPTKWNLPISKYSTQDSTKCLAPSPPILEKSVASSATSPNGHDNLADAASNKMDDEIASGEKGRSDTKRRPEPILTGSDLPDRDAARDDDKKSVDDAQSTIVEDGQSVTVASPQSPVATLAASQPNEQPTPRILRTVSSPTGSPRANAGDPPSSSRSVSGSAFQQNRASQPPGTGHLTPRASVKVGSGISSRIKAFEQIAAKSGPPAPIALPGVSKDRPSSAFFSVRQNSIRDGARSPSVLERTNSIYRGRTPTPNESLDGSPETARSTRERSGSVASRMSVFEGGNAPRGKPETISVTARIVREPGQHYPRPPSQVDFSDYSFSDLKQSPLLVDHQKASEEMAPVPPTDAPPVPTPLVHAGEPRRSLQERRLSKDTKHSSVDDPFHRPGQRTSLTMARDFIRESMVGKDNGSASRPPSVHVHQASSLMSRLSISTRRKSITQDSALQSPTSGGEESESGSGGEKKEGNRASRIMRRLSSTFSPKKSSLPATSPRLPEESNESEKAIPPRAMTAPAAPEAGSIVTSMGDVNVQFPENLLWKRRSMSLDSNGFLHLTPAQGAVSARERQSKRYHMSEFKSPYAPEIEVQELPNSICLDFLSGSGLQFAFQDRAGQLSGLQILRDAHQKHTSFGR